MRQGKGRWGLAASLLLALMAPGGALAEAPRASVEPLFRLRAGPVSSRPGLVELDLDSARLRQVARQPGLMQVPGFPLPAAAAVDLELAPFSITSPRTRFVLGRKGQPDVPVEFDPDALLFLRGRIPGRPGSHVFMAVAADDAVTGFVDLGDGSRRYRISSRAVAGEKPEPGRVAVFQAEAVASMPPDVPLCGVTGASHGLATAASSFMALAEQAVPRRGLKHLELAVETDYEFFVIFGDATAALTYLTMMYAEVSDIYLRDVDTRVELVFARLWETPDDLFNVVDPSPLPEFRAYWNANMGAVTRDAAQLLSGRRDYPFGGQAYVSALCGLNAYSVVGYALGFFPDPHTPTPYTYDIQVTAHELGHNSGTGHTHESPNFVDDCANITSTPQRGTIMSYCSQTWSGGNANNDLYFHARIQQNMDAHIGSSACIIDDCNLNGVADVTDITQSTSLDVNTNSIPDECEDCNGNLVLDGTDIALATSQDVDANGVPDECQPDCNANAIPDVKDIADATSTDLYGNDIPDECEADCDADTISDYTEIQLDMSLDIDRSTVLDACQDCDGDGMNDVNELGGAHRVWVASGLTASGLREFHASTGVLTRLSAGGAGSTADGGQDVIVAPGGRILVSSAGDHRVLEFDGSGVFVGDLVTAGSGGLSVPAGMVLTPDGTTLRVASSGSGSVLTYDAVSGASQGAFVMAGAGGLSAPFGMVYSPGGNLLVTSAGNQVLEFDGQSGAFLRVLVSAAASGGLDQARGMAFKPDGNLLVASFGTDQVLEFDGVSGAPLGRWALGGTNDELTQISPWGIRIGPNGNVFVSRTGESFASGGGAAAGLHFTNAQIYEFDATNGYFLRAYIGGNDHGLFFPTGFDFVPGWDLDCNFNLLQDDCDISLGTSLDQDLSGIPDECEADCNGNGQPDRLELIPHGSLLDCNSNLLPDSCDIASAVSADCTANGVPDECELDCNQNFIADSCEIQAGTSFDCNGNGVPDECDVADDLEIDSGWTAGVPGDTATTGIWTRVDPLGTGAQPEDDHTPGIGVTCFVTGQGTPGGSLGENDVDGGATTLISPAYNLAGDAGVEMAYWRWFSNNTGGAANQDVMTVEVSGDGQAWALVETVGPTGAQTAGGWFFHRFRVADFITPTSTVSLRFVASDTGGGSIVEAAIDDLVIFPGCCLVGGLPPEITGVTVDLSGTAQVSWAAQGPGLSYDIAGGVVSDLRPDGGAAAALCLADDLAVTTWSDARPDPPPGQAHYYLVRTQGSCGTGSYGQSTAGSERLPTAACP